MVQIKNTINGIKKIFILTFLMLLCSVNIFALSLETNQQDNLQSFYIKDSGNYQIRNAVGSVNTNYGTINNNTYYYDLDFEFVSVTEDFYLILENYFVNQTLTIMWRGDLNRDPTLYIQDFVMNEVGRYYFKFSPQYTDEPARIYLDFESDSYVGTIEYIEQKPQGFNTLMGGFVNAFLDIVSININLWRIVFYTLIFIILVGFVGLVFGGAWYVFGKSKELKEDKGFHYKYKGDD